MKILKILILILLPVSVMAQEFAPVGAKWYYTEYYAFQPDIGYLYIESVKDTVFQEENCRILEKGDQLWCNNRPNREIVYSQDSAVYFWDQNFGKFQTLYDFKTPVDSSWSILIPGSNNNTDTVKVFVDSIRNEKILDNTQKVLYVTYRTSYNGNTLGDSPSKIVYAIGDFKYLFNFYPSSSLACDFNFTGGLRCYEDPYFGYYSTGIADSCTYTRSWLGVENVQENAFKPKIAPNPTLGEVKINCMSNTNYKFALFDQLGRKMTKGIFTGDVDLNLSSYPNGVYFILIQNNKGIRNFAKIIKE